MITETKTVEETQALVEQLFGELPSSHKVLGCLRNDLRLNKHAFQIYQCASDNELLGVLLYYNGDSCTIWVKSDDREIAVLLLRQLPPQQEFNFVCWPQKLCDFNLFDMSVGMDPSYVYFLDHESFVKAKGMLTYFLRLHSHLLDTLATKEKLIELRKQQDIGRVIVKKLSLEDAAAVEKTWKYYEPNSNYIKECIAERPTLGLFLKQENSDEETLVSWYLQHSDLTLGMNGL
jgi:hypothetical protein